LQLSARKNSFSKEFALRAQADRMSALPTAPGTDIMAKQLEANQITSASAVRS
ncbi:MAG: hypothetical protein QOG23_4472, partial [Blastocatellia bacterium]|nr:hypothetical protein [Blastocatellia bacterium]